MPVRSPSTETAKEMADWTKKAAVCLGWVRFMGPSSGFEADPSIRGTPYRVVRDPQRGSIEAMPEPTVWFNPGCSKCRTAQGILEDRGAAAHYVDYLHEPPTTDELRGVLSMMGTADARTIARTGEPQWAELGLDGASNDEILDAMSQHPILIERPIVIVGERAVVARPPERLLELLDTPEAERRGFTT